MDGVWIQFSRTYDDSSSAAFRIRVSFALADLFRRFCEVDKYLPDKHIDMCVLCSSLTGGSHALIYIDNTDFYNQ